ncbi:hypothetical protein [Idiomarina sp. UBA3162]|uniref:hypothetical protein n=1 Tax=Idiomarina sp. UBA3162 TaxID=1946641 RepID=UPI000C8C1CBD|nr:hypothetical protein [Idiomarina sp. UBA3162]MAD54269.1 hypothetical protein [Idiomarinaceae bacterium]
MMGVSLYTSRILLDTLGAEDFGLYHVVAGIVVLAGFLQGALSGTTQRFLAFELGKKEATDLRNVFGMSVNIHIIFALLMLVIVGGVGTYIVPSIITFDESRLTAVIFLFWFSLVSFALNIAVVPFHAMIVAHEEMRIFAWISIGQAVLNLGIVILIQYLPYDALIAYGALTLLATTVVSGVYVAYVLTRYKEQRFCLGWDQKLFKRLVSFSGWSIWGNAAPIFSNQGINILLNVYFGPLVNAAKSIGNQASNALGQFVSNLQYAVNPQIIKSYSRNDHSYTIKLLYYGSKYNFFLIFTLAFPILLRTENVLKIWLVEPPPYSATFLKLILINAILDSIFRPLITAAQATGNIKLYQIVVGGILLLNVPFSYVVVQMGYNPSSVFIVAILVTILAAVARIFMLKRIFNFSFTEYSKCALIKIFQVSALSISLGTTFNHMVSVQLNILEMLLFCFLVMLITGFCVWMLGLERSERGKILSFIKSKGG